MLNGRHATERWARLSRDGRHRLLLGREWDAALPMVAFVGLNPSTADGITDDPTIRRCMGFARDWGFGGVLVANLFTFRATDPRDLEAWGDRLAFGADHAIRDAANEAALVIEAWGTHPLAAQRSDHVRSLLAGRSEIANLGLTKNGAPRHPLYVPGETLPTLVGGVPARLPVAQRVAARAGTGSPLGTGEPDLVTIAAPAAPFTALSNGVSAPGRRWPGTRQDPARTDQP